MHGLDEDLPGLSHDRLVEQLRQHGFHIPNDVPYFIFHLATGVGKTRLMGAVLSYLYRSEQSRNTLILAPRAAIVDRLERVAQPGSDQYLFLDPTLVREVNLCFRGNLESFEPRKDAFNVFVLSPQSISGGEKRFARPREFRGGSIRDYLESVDDLVVFTDEAHHLGADDEAAWTAAIHSLKPRLHFGLTATPKSGPGVNVLHSYDLPTCLQEGLYTKGVRVLVDPRDDAMSEEEWDRHTLDYALRRLDRKREALREYANSHEDFDFIEPVALICARDIDHAEEVAAWLTERRGFERDELIVTHSQKAQTESEIARLVAIDETGNRIRVVVNVYQLTEGWDVRNVYVIAPLRAMATFQGAVQTMGRGLRLPAGRRVEDEDIDTLDILCFGRESLEEIIRNATEAFGVEVESGPPIEISSREAKDDQDQPILRKEMRVRCLKPTMLEVPSVRRVPADPQLDFDVRTVGDLAGGMATAIDLRSFEASGVTERVGYDIDDVVRIATARIIARLRYLSDIVHGPAVEDLVLRFLLAIDASPDTPLYVDPVKVSIHLAEEIDRRYRTQESQFELDGDPASVEITDVVLLVPDALEAPVVRMPVLEWTR